MLNFYWALNVKFADNDNARKLKSLILQRKVHGIFFGSMFCVLRKKNYATENITLKGSFYNN
jgi:hypothetical protein